MGWRWPWRRRVQDTSDEAQAALAQLEANEPEVRRLEAELRETQRKNNFSGMVDAAISRRARAEGT